MGPTASTGRVVPGLLVVVVVAIVLGIVGMHAMSAHGVTSEASHGGHASLSGDTSEPVGGVVLDPGPDPVAADTGDGSDEGGGRDMGGMGSMAMLCAAMLAAASALLLLTLGVRRTPRFWALLPAATTTKTRFRWVTFRLGTGPPPVWEFSVIRC